MGYEVVESLPKDCCGRLLCPLVDYPFFSPASFYGRFGTTANVYPASMRPHTLMPGHYGLFVRQSPSALLCFRRGRPRVQLTPVQPFAMTQTEQTGQAVRPLGEPYSTKKTA